MMKYAAYIGNVHCKIRLTPFFDTREEAIACAKSLGHLTVFAAPCANWQEHQAWNAARVGNYALWPVTE